MGKICCSLCRNLFFPVLILFKHKKTQYESHPIFPFSDGFHKLELCIGLNPFFFVLLFLCFTLGYFVTFSWVHTTNPVPFILVNADPSYTLREGGCLADIAPTLIELMGMEQPKEMTGKSLLIKK